MSQRRPPPSPEQREALDAALEGRPPRADDAYGQQLRRILETVDRLPRPEPSPHLRAGLEARLEALENRDPSWFETIWAAFRSPLGAGFGLAAGAAAVALVVMGRTPEPLDRAPEALARMERLEVAEDLEMYENLEVLEHLDVLQDLELIVELPEESG